MSSTGKGNRQPVRSARKRSNALADHVRQAPLAETDRTALLQSLE